MKTLVSLLAGMSGLAFAAAATDARTVPEGIAPSDWSDIRAAYEAGRHVPQRQEDGRLVACNPGQQWHAEFDGKGFTVTPDDGAWTWGLELTGYGNRALQSVASPSQLRHEGGRITCRRDEDLTEWFINDSRGLEQGWDIRQRPERADPSVPLQLHLATRGSVSPLVSAGGDSVSFQQESGSSVVTYSGLKAWDADGKKLPVRFEQAGGNRIRIAVDDQGARYPVTIDPVAQQAYLKASNTDEDDHFGSAVAVSGDTVVVGVHGEDSAATGVNGDQTNNGASYSGAVYVFVRSISKWGGPVWNQQAYLKASNTGEGDLFGAHVAISGDTVIVGALSEDSNATGVNGDQTSNGAPQSGAAYIFLRSGTTWAQQAYLKASNTDSYDGFGISVAISGDTAVVGTDQGNAAYVFLRSGTAWAQQAYLISSSPVSGDRFGGSVAVSGNTVIVGAHGDDSAATGVNGNQSSTGAPQSGAAYVFLRSGTSWVQQAYLKASNTGTDDYFGYSVAIAGDTAVVGAYQEDSNAAGVNGDQTSNGAPQSGAAYVFTRSGTMWTQQAYLKASNTGAEDFFGYSVAVSGDTAVVGAYREDSNATGVNGDQTNNDAPQSGAAYVFARSGVSWTQQAYVKASNTGAEDFFGSPLAVSGNTVVLGATNQEEDYSPLNGGAAYIMELNPVPALFVMQPLDFENGGIASGGSRSFGPTLIGEYTDLVFWIVNFGYGPLVFTGTPEAAITGSSDFTVAGQPEHIVNPRSGGDFFSTHVRVRFTPTSPGIKSATLSLASNDPNANPFIIHLTGGGSLSVTADTDGDGLSDLAEYNMAALNFDWQVKQTDLVNTYFANANRAGLFTSAQVHALHAGTPLIARDPGSGRFKLTTHWRKSTNLADFFDFPAPAGSSVSISPSGGIEFEFTSPDNAAFFRIEQE